MSTYTTQRVTLPMRNNSHFAKHGNAVCERRMGTEQRRTCSPVESEPYDAHRGSRSRNRSRGIAVIVRAKLFESVNRSVGVAHHPRACCVGRILPLPRETQLQQHGGDGCQKEHEDSPHSAAVTVVTVAPVPSKNHGPAAHRGEVENRSGYRCGYRTDQDVVVANVRQLVSDNAFEFVVIHQLEQTLRHCHGSVARVSSGGKSVWRGLRNDIKFRHGQVRLCGEALHNGIEPWQLFARYRLSSAGHQRDLVRKKVSESVHDHGQSKGKGHAAASAKILPDQHQQERKSYQQKGCAKDSHISFCSTRAPFAREVSSSIVEEQFGLALPHTSPL